MPQKVVLDTNFLLIPGQLGVDIIEEIRRRLDFPYELWVAQGTLAELDKLESGKTRAAARVAKSLIARHGIRKLRHQGTVDDALAGLSHDCIVATQDAELKRRLKARKLVLRQKKYVELI